MTKRIAINGFGRIGRMILRALHESGHSDMEVVAVNDLSSAGQLAYLLQFDSVHGRFNADVSAGADHITVDGKTIPVFAQRDPEALPWSDLNVDLVMECTGYFRTQELSGKHIKAGAKKVLISAPAKDDSKTVVFGVNDDIIGADDHIISNASCTTNALAPVLKVLDDSFGVEGGIMTTVHAYTGTQRLHDGAGKDFYRGRAAAVSMIPTTTGAAKAIGKVLPHLDGLIDGVAVRIPVPNVSMVDLTVNTAKQTDIESVCAAMESASKGPLKGVLACLNQRLVSVDLTHDPHSSSFVPDQTRVKNGNLIRVMSWYDNEWGFSNRMLDTAGVMLR